VCSDAESAGKTDPSLTVIVVAEVVKSAANTVAALLLNFTAILNTSG
jgi:hypothetical protein